MIKKLIVVLSLLVAGAGAAWAQDRPDSFADLVDEISPAVVNIRTTKTVTSSLPNRFTFRGPGGQEFDQDDMPDMLRRFFGLPDNGGGGGGGGRDLKQRSLGSGVIVDKDGYVLTNNHVIANADEIMVMLSSGEELPARIVGRDAKTDLALVKVAPGKNMPFLPLGDSEKLRVGDWVLALGNPFGLTSTVTAGIVSAKGRNIGAGPYDDFIQTDASINPGNSGGPLVDLGGRVVGINTAIVAQGQGIGFAIPSSLVGEVMKQLREQGKVTRGWLGIYFQRVNRDLARVFAIDENKGVLVSDVMPGGPAAKAGLKRGDIILSFDDKEINNGQTLPRMVAETPVGSKVKVTVMRQGEKIGLNIVIGEMPEDGEEVSSSSPLMPDSNLGMNLQEITPGMTQHLNLEAGAGLLVISVESGGPADEAGVMKGDVLLEVSRTAVNTLREFREALSRLDGKEGILLLLQRSNVTHYVVVRPEG
ncbi:MAG: DegQ family serine endoprotease [Desulfarculales bacterium]|jgi:serine protease Do|nr:DegQ family serine endoprotease [Desulfarculales bacterium]